jgi:hypothetical protein
MKAFFSGVTNNGTRDQPVLISNAFKFFIPHTVVKF